MEAWNHNTQWQRLPRKVKKQYLGRKINTRDLKKLIKSVELILADDSYNVWISPYNFCPQCGCQTTYSFDHNVEYPEIWTEDFCARCHSFVGGADNSRYVHVLEDMRGE